METETARSILYIITTIAIVVWLTGLRFLVVSFRRDPPPAELLDDPAAGAQPSAEGSRLEGLITGHAEVEGQPAELAARAAAILARESQGMLEPLKILERTDDRVTFEGTGEISGKSLPTRVRLGQLRFSPLGSQRTAIDYAIVTSASWWLSRIGAAFQAVGLVAIFLGFWLIWTYVTAHPNPGIRGQTFQMVQVVHFLWPPFLFGGLYRMGRRAVQNRFDTLAHNLPYYQAESLGTK